MHEANATTTTAIKLISHTAVGYSTGNGTLPVTTSSIDTTGANFIAACHVHQGNWGFTSIAPTDSMGNTWTLGATINQGAAERVELWYVFNPATSTKHTFAFSGSYSSGTVMAFSGVTSGPDKQGTALANLPASVSVTPSQPGELVLSCLALQTGTDKATIQTTLTALDWVACQSCTLAQPHSYQTASAYQIQTAASTVKTGWTTTDGSTPLGEVVTDTFSPGTVPPPLLVTGFPAKGTVGTYYSYQLQHTGGIAPFVWAIKSGYGQLPAGLTMTSSGLIAGTPTATVATAPFVVTVTDAKGAVAYSNGFSIAFTSAATGSTQTSVTIPAVTCPVGTQYQPYPGCKITASGGTPPYTYAWNKTSSYLSLPEGLKVDLSTGTITGTPTGEGSGYVMGWTATDHLGHVSPVRTVEIDLKGDNTLGGCSLFPADSIFHLRVDGLPVDHSPAAAIGPTYKPSSSLRLLYETNTGGIPFLRVPWDEALNPVIVRDYQGYFGTTSGGAWCTPAMAPLCGDEAPIPFDAPVEGTLNRPGDNHVLIVQTGNAATKTPCKLWEMWSSHLTSTYWNPGSDAYWGDLDSYDMPPDDYGTADAAGLPITPFLVTADEVIGTGTPAAPKGSVEHAIRFTLTDATGTYLHAHVWPATAQAGSGTCSGGYTDPAYGGKILQTGPPVTCTSSPAFGEMYRLKAGVPAPACASTSPQAAVIIDGLRKYGLIYADRGASGFMMATPDARWNSTDLACLQQLHLTDFEPVNVGSKAVTKAVSQGSTTYHVPSSYQTVP